MKVRDMFTKEFADEYCDLDVSESVTDEMEIGFCGALLTAEGLKEFSLVLDDNVDIFNRDGDYRWAVVDIDPYEEGIWQKHQKKLFQLFGSLAGYCSEEHWSLWFMDIE